MNRRSFLLRAASVSGSAGLLASCSRGKRFTGYAFVANAEGGAVAAVDLGVLAVARYVRLNGNPTAVFAHPNRPFVYALTPNTGRVHEIGTGTLTLLRTTKVCDEAITMRLSTDGASVYVLCQNPQRLVALDTASLRVVWQTQLPAASLDFEVDPGGEFLAVSHGASGKISIVSTARRAVDHVISTGSETGLVCFRSDSKLLIAASPAERTLNFYRMPDGALEVKLPLAVRPDHFCFKQDQGQLFVTGDGMDAVVAVYPYFTPQIGGTVLAGHAPGAMAASREFLFVANSKSGDVSVLNIETQRVIAVAPAGANPSFIAITPDNQYALVLNQASGDMGVILIPSITRTRRRTASLFTMIPVGSSPVSAAVVQI